MDFLFKFDDRADELHATDDLSFLKESDNSRNKASTSSSAWDLGELEEVILFIVVLVAGFQVKLHDLLHVHVKSRQVLGFGALLGAEDKCCTVGS